MISEKESYEEIVTDGIYNETTIADQIHTKWAGKTVHFARETDSTNLWIKRLAKEGASEHIGPHAGQIQRLCTGRISVSRKRKTWQILGGTRGYVGYDEHSSQTEI